MKSIFNVQKSILVEEVAKELQKIDEIKPLPWAYFVKTGANKERPPVDNDWWYKRSASIMIKILSLGPIGVSKLRVKYGGKKRRGHKPAEFRKASGNIIRKILQQLEKAGLVKQTKIGVHKGRILTPKAISLLSKTAKSALPNQKKDAKAEKPDKDNKTKEIKTKPKKEDKKDSTKDNQKKDEKDTAKTKKTEKKQKEK